MDTGQIIYEEYTKDGNLHREDGPARKWGNDDEAWYKDGKLHREDGPAIIEYICIQGPASELTSNIKIIRQEWWQNGKIHRHISDGPAIEYVTETREPLTEYESEYWVNGYAIYSKFI